LENGSLIRKLIQSLKN